jgi:23S rRNA (adenine-N6)-dimethyltransferase
MARVPRSLLWHTQNFLRRPALVDALLDRAGVGRNDLVYEIGAGAGAITERLATRCRRVVAVEKDPMLAALLRARFAGRADVVVREADALRDRLPAPPYKVFASIPFDATAALVTRLTTAAAPPEEAHLVVQSEAAERYVGVPRQTLAALLLQPWFETAVVHRFRRRDFAPAPNVDAVLLRLRKRGPPLVDEAERQLYRDFVVACFTAWQPSVRAALGPVVGARRAAELTAAALPDPALPPSAVPFAAWRRLYRAFADGASAAERRRVAGAEAHLRAQQSRLRKVHRTRARGGSRLVVRPPPVALCRPRRRAPGGCA